MFKRLKQTKIYQDQWLTFYQDEIQLPDGSTSTYAYADRKDGVNVVAVTPDNKILLNKEYRYVIDGYSWEIPGGGIDEGETPEEAAVRELEEETGVKISEVEKLGEFYPLHSFNQEKVTLFLARIEETALTSIGTENSEHVADQKFVTFPEVLAMIDNGEINDTMTAHAIQMVVRKHSSR